MPSLKTSSPERERIGVRFVSDAVKRDHRVLEKLYASLTGTTKPDGTDGVVDGTDGIDGVNGIDGIDGIDGHEEGEEDSEQQREHLLHLEQQRFCWELARHLVALSLFIFPGTSRRARQGNQNAKDRQRDFALLRAKLLGLVDAATATATATAAGAGAEDGGGGAEEEEEDGALYAVSGGQGFRECLLGLREDLARHIKDVERTDLVAIEKVLSGEESERLARDFEATVWFIPPEVREDTELGEEDVAAPFESVGDLLNASVEELLGALQKFPKD